MLLKELTAVDPAFSEESPKSLTAFVAFFSSIVALPSTTSSILILLSSARDPPSEGFSFGFALRGLGRLALVLRDHAEDL